MTKQIEDGGPAFPRPVSEDSSEDGLSYPDQEGMSMRDYFAAKAMQGLYANGENIPSDVATVAAWVYDIADAMLAARGGK